MAPVWNPDDNKFPTRKELPAIDGAPEGSAWWCWGKDDELGRLNLLTPKRVKEAAKIIQTGEIVPVNLALNHPEVPFLKRPAFEHKIIKLLPDVAYDDAYTLNTQSGTQWDGFRHFAHLATKTFYNGTKAADIDGENPNNRGSIHYWAEHGIAGRGVLIDFLSWAEKKGLDYDAYGHYEISYDELDAAAKDQGIDIRPAAQGGDIQIGDLLFVRTGLVKAYFSKSREERNKLSIRHGSFDEKNEEVFSGLKQEEKILDWLHDCYFSMVAGDAPAFEAWPSHHGWFIHEHVIALWGMSIGEMLDLEKLAETCRRHNRWTFFFTSSPANVIGGVASHVNGQAIF